ncbi:MAG: redoxin domain-containing protein [Anaerolineales bacterium]|nr:redoxin domain-containing protein [Anaerolineales bacterium]
MPWIRFDPQEETAPALRLETPGGAPFELADLRGRSSVALLFTHGFGCRACRAAISDLRQQREAFRSQEAELLIVVPSREGLPPGDAEGILVDPGAAGRRDFAALLEFDTGRSAMLFILDRYGTPYAAWFGDEPLQAGLADEALDWLEFISIQCPE